NSGALSVTPRFRSVISVIIVLRSCRPIATSGACSHRRMSVSKRGGEKNAGANARKRATLHRHEGQTRNRFWKGEPLVSPANAFAGLGPDHAGDNAGRMSSSRGPPFPIEWGENSVPCEGEQAGLSVSSVREREVVNDRIAAPR